ncbi:hypothetical protein C8J56DRAFT_1134729 [Mycena floridula]|nr:hypothetical protein C8J56DRAFT_1134729 [Mycena floridula]
MKYVALLSGGKDSCFNLVHCQKNGHELVAAASLGPEPGKEELDSYLYQTVGQDAIHLVAESLDVPLYRAVISGDAVEQGADYGGRDSKEGVLGDETEDLTSLLLEVKRHHPDIQGVSVGAILSNYQRVRVEHVCHRLNLTCLCYLWQRPQDELLAEMIEAGMECILIKVAGIGLTIKHLGKTLGEMQETLQKLNELYGSHICGEGGEYESLTLDCPLFKSRIVLKEVETVIHSDNDFATVAFLRVRSAHLEPKQHLLSVEVGVPPLLDEIGSRIQDIVLPNDLPSQTRTVNDGLANSAEFRVASIKRGSWISVTNVQADLKDGYVISFQDEVRECFLTLQARLKDHSLELMHCVNINLFLSSMDLFPEVNSVYATFFATSPPARACVAVDLPAPHRVTLDCIACAETSASYRQALHVQSLSYWAPANIGPYSQAIAAYDHVFISGQIGLIPSSLLLPSPPSLLLETALACQHADRVVEALQSGSGGGWLGHKQLALYWVANAAEIPSVVAANEAYLEASKSPPMPTLFVAVKSLPKNALVEKQISLHTGRFLLPDEDDGELAVQTRTPRFNQAEIDENRTFEAQVLSFEDSGVSCRLICIKEHGSSKLEMKGILPQSLSIRLFYIPSKTNWRDLFSDEDPVTPIPCRHIATKDGENWDYAICILTVSKQ